MIFINNKYTRYYFAIVNRAKNRITAEKTEEHHVVPESFFKNRSRKGRKGWLDGNPEDPDNKVFLTLHEHFVCHLLLTKMVKGTEAQHKVDSAAVWLADCYLSKNNGVRITGRLYARLRAEAAKAQAARKIGQVAPIKGMRMWNNGVTDTMSLTQPGPEYVLGSLIRGDTKAHTKGTKWWINGTEKKMSKECPGPGWVKGNGKTKEQASTCLGRKKWNNGLIEISSIKSPGPDFVLGRLGKFWNNGTINRYSNISPGPDFIEGKMPKSQATTKNTFWWNDGVVNNRSKVCPGDSFVLGKIKKSALL